jgi:outer membrane protein assembly factor BamB
MPSCPDGRSPLSGFVLLAVLSSVIAGCSDTRAPVAAVAIDTTGGVIHVRNRTLPVAWPLSEIASVDGTPAGFTRIYSLTVDGDGNIYVADNGESTIRVFDPHGDALRTIGRRGSGPAEFLDLYSVAWLGDTLVALDPGNSRVGLLTRDGVWLGERILSRRMTGRGIQLLEGDGAVFVPSITVVDTVVQRTFIRQTALGFADTVVLPSMGNEARNSFITCEFPHHAGIADFAVPFASHSLITVNRSGSPVLANTGGYRIIFMSSKADTVRTVEAPASPEPVTPRDWADSLAEFRSFQQKYPGAHCEPNDPKAPSAKSVIGALWFDDQHRLWVERRDGRGHGYDVFDSGGVLIGTMAAPARDQDINPYVRDGRLYLVAMDSAGAQTIKVYRFEAMGSRQ